MAEETDDILLHIAYVNQNMGNYDHSYQPILNFAWNKTWRTRMLYMNLLFVTM